MVFVAVPFQGIVTAQLVVDTSQ